MTTTAQQLITAEEFARMPEPADGSRQELVRGVIVTMPPPGFRHGEYHSNIFYFLKHYVRAHPIGRVTVESGLRTQRGPDTVRGPDIAFWSAERMPLNVTPLGYPDVVADLCVEILSPNQTRAGLREKVREYLDCCVRMVWIVDPDDRSVTVYRSPDHGRILHEGATLSGDDVLPGFTVPVAELFTQAG
jgi:Uma2 family endonuclease